VVAVVDRPDPDVDGIIVMDGSRPENLLLFEAQPDRSVVIARKDAALLSRIWDAGVRHVVFEEDSPSTALLAVVAAELRAPHVRDSKALPVLVGDGRKRLLPTFPVPILNTPSRTPCCFTRIRKTPF
jgi:hypothetical protein